MVRSFHASFNVISEVAQGIILGPMLFILYTPELIHIVGNYIVGYADDATLYAIIHRPLSRPQW